MMKKSDFESILRGMEEALAYHFGKDNGCVVHTPEMIQARRDAAKSDPKT